MSTLGKILRHLRVDHNEVLYDMAKKLGVTSSFLSAVENGGKAPPLYWVDSLSKLYDLSDSVVQELQEAVAQSIKQVRIDVKDQPRTTRNMVLAFARSYESLNESDVNKIMKILGKKEVSSV